MKRITNSHLCFAGGDLLVTLFTLLWGGDITHFFLKAFGTIIIGIIGGVAGLAGKDLYPVLKKYIQSKLFKNKKSS
jgi:hypothetical protein